MRYCEESVNQAILTIKMFSADMGGTEIFEPLQSAVEILSSEVVEDGR
jgi:hypothetical protein